MATYSDATKETSSLSSLVDVGLWLKEILTVGEPNHFTLNLFETPAVKVGGKNNKNFILAAFDADSVTLGVSLVSYYVAEMLFELKPDFKTFDFDNYEKRKRINPYADFGCGSSIEDLRFAYNSISEKNRFELPIVKHKTVSQKNDSLVRGYFKDLALAQSVLEITNARVADLADANPDARFKY